MATQNDLSVIEDNDTAITFTIKQNGAAINLTGYSIVMYIKTSLAVEEVSSTFTYSTANGQITLSTQSGATLGQCVVQTRAVDLATPTTYRYRLDVTNTSAQRLTYSYGKLKIVDV